MRLGASSGVSDNTAPRPSMSSVSEPYRIANKDSSSEASIVSLERP